MKLDKADVIFAKYIKTRDGWRCKRCGVQYQEGDRGLHCSHFHGRTRESTRFDEDNCISLCMGCHKYFDEVNRQSYCEFKQKQLGEEKYKALRVRADTLIKKDREMSYIIAKQLLLNLIKCK